MKQRRQLLLRFRNDTQEQIDDLNDEGSGLIAELEADGHSTVILAAHLKDLTAALALVERELAKRGLRRILH